MPNVRNGAVRKVSGLLNLVHLFVKIVSNKLTLRVGFEGEFGDKFNHIHRKKCRDHAFHKCNVLYLLSRASNSVNKNTVERLVISKCEWCALRYSIF